MSDGLTGHAAETLRQIDEEGLTKRERRITSPQSAMIEIEENGDRREILNLCANNYLGLADHPRLIDAARGALDDHGFGMASVRFICGTSDLHQRLEARVAQFQNCEDAILYSSCFDANTGLFETILGEEDAIISDALNHASIIDGVRLCKARRYRYHNDDMADLEAQLEQAQDARYRLIATDGVFSMDGVIANLPRIFELAEQYDATVMVDESHAVGVLGASGAGTVEYHGLGGRSHIVTGTFGKALGGASGGYTAGPRPIIELLRQRSRPYLFSNALAPAICAATLEALDLIAEDPEPFARLHENAAYFRAEMTARGFLLTGADHPIVPVMIGEAAKAAEFAKAMGGEGIYVTAFSFPVVPRGAARIRTQMSAAHTRAHLDKAIAAFESVGRSLGVI